MPATWNTFSTHLDFWHGCLDSNALHIRSSGVDLNAGRPGTDFGRGFYLTTNRSQAEERARWRFWKLPPNRRRADAAAIVLFRVPRDELVGLDTLSFVRGDLAYEEYWSFVAHCRQSTPTAIQTHLHPRRTAPDDWYDVVCGPVAASWPPDDPVALPDFDQFSFHTPAAVAILNDVIRRGRPDFHVIRLP